MRSPLGALVSTRSVRNAAAGQLAPVPLTGRISGAVSALFGGSPAERGAQLDAMGSVGTLFGIVDRTASSTAQVEWKLWRKSAGDDPDDRTQVTSHAALDLLNNPNTFYTRQEMIEAGTQHYDLTGETWLVLLVSAGLPLTMFPVRPDRMRPIPHPDRYIVGYEYTGPDGEKVPLATNEVIFIRRPNPKDPYRGFGPVQSLLADLDAAKYSAAWNRNFFLNSAEPGGIIHYPTIMDDITFEQQRMRWAEQHRGVANAHRVAILEGDAEWIDRKFTQRDMQFAELRNLSREVIREAYGFPEFMAGIVKDVNRASADASEAMFARWLTVPRLDRWKQAFNHDLLPMYGPQAAQLYEFDYESPVPADREADNAELTARATAVSLLVPIGFDAAETLDAVGLPPIAWERPPQPTQLAVHAAPGQADNSQPGDIPVDDGPAPAGDGGVPSDRVPVPTPRAVTGTRLFRHRNADSPEPGSLEQVQADWLASRDQLVGDWNGQVTPAQRQQLLDQVRTAVDRNETETLGTLVCASAIGAGLLTAAMIEIAELGAESIAHSAAAHGHRDVHPAVPDPDTLRATAVAVSALLAASLAASAGREALRLATPEATGDEVATAVGTFLDGLSDRPLLDALGGALTGAQNAGRMATMAIAPEARYVAAEDNDTATCKPCSEIDGHEFDTLQDARSAYPNGGYVNCLGGIRCRGTVDPIWYNAAQ